MINACVVFRYSEKDILKSGRIISNLLFGKEDMFKGLETCLRDEVPFIYTDNFAGCYLGIMQNPECPNVFSLEIVDISNDNGDNSHVDLTDRLMSYLKKCPEIEIIPSF